MRQENDSTLKAQLSVDDDDRVREISHVQEPWESGEASPVLAAVEYLRRATGVLNVSEAEMGNPLRKLSFTEPKQQGGEYHFGDEKTLFDSSTVVFNQTYLNVPVWRAAVTLTIKHNPNRVLTVTDTSEQGVDAPLPPQHKIEEHRRLFAMAAADQRLRVLGLEDQAGAAGLAEADEAPKTASFVRRVLGREAPAALMGTETEEPPADDARAIRGRFFVYRYDAARRIPPGAHIAVPPDGATEAEQAAAASLEVNGQLPSLELPPVDPSVADGAWRLVSEVTFTLTTPELGRLNWRSLVDVETDSVLLLEPLVAGQFGFVFHRDPISSTGVLANGPNQNNAVLNPLRNTVELPNLVSPSDGVQTLRGRFAVVTNVEQPNVAPPTVAAGSRFDFDVRTNDFAAVNAYYHTDRFFALVESLGFPIASYFDHTNFPVTVDHRDNVYGNANTINARCEGNGEGGIGFAGYCLNDLSNTANPIGRACDSRVHLHELGGHGVLYEHVDHPNFGFAHSAGDSISAILHDPDSRLRDDPAQRFRYAPWNPVNDRRFDRPVEQWAWGGPVVKDAAGRLVSGDDRGYGSEQILCTTMFRVYRSIGGDSPDLNRRRFASRATIYLILRAISTLTPATNPRNALGFANALMAVDLLNWTTEGVFGGAYNKVIRWAFEKQGLFQAPGAPTPVTKQGRPPAVDVYIDDGRRGEYQFQADHTRNPSVWNRRAADGGTTHQEPAAGVTNFAYVRVKNRGTTQAQNVRVRGFHLRPGGAAVWPTDFQPLTTAELVVGTLSPNNQQEKIVGPFAWVPAADALGRDRLMMVVSANGDASNADHFTGNESIADWRLVPNDNNIGMRSVVPTAGESAQPDASGAGATGSGATPGGGERLLRELGFTGQRLKNVRVKSVTFQVDLDDEVASEIAPSSDEDAPAAPRARAASLAPVSEMPAAAAASEAEWGIRRHGLIGTAAWERMRSQRAREEILRIFEESGGETSLGECARWADRIKSDPPNDAATRRFLSEERDFSTWHYVNLPLNLDGYDRERYPEFTRRNDIVQTILRCVASLRAPGPNARFEEVIALRWLTHLVGDLHQPVHVGCGYIVNARTNRARLVFDPAEAVGLGSDRGGGALLLPDANNNLHGYWDSQLGPNFVPDALDAGSDEELLSALVNTPFESAFDEDVDIAARVVGWTNQSLAEAKKAYETLRIVSYNPTSNGGEFYKVAWEGEQAYRVRCAPIVSERMAAAANNLAGLLDTIWPESA